MPKLQTISLVMITAGLALMFSTYYEWLYTGQHDFSMSQILANILSIVNPASQAEPTIEPQGFYLTEQRSAVFFYALSVVVFLFAAALSLFHRFRFGRSKLFVPLTFASSMGCFCVVALVRETGVLYGT